MTSPTAERRSWRRWLGVCLVLYGVAGIALAAAGAVLVSASFRGVDRLVDTIVAQRNTIVLTLDTTAAFIGNAATGTESVDAILVDASTATRDAATMTRSLAAAADEVARAATFQIFGQQPFGGVATSFARVSADALALASDLEGAANTIGGTGEATAGLRDDLRTVADQVRQFSRSLAGTVALDDIEGAFDPPRIVLYGLLAWLGIQAVAAVIGGLALVLAWRRPRVIVVDEAPNPF